MSYRFLSFRSGSEHDIAQWNARSIEGELRSFENRTLSSIFEKYLHGGKAKILEGGCGFGAWCRWLERRGHEVTGIEYDPRVIARAKEFDRTVPIELGNVLSLDYPDSAFDAYISLGVIEHFENGPQPALKEAWRILKPGGTAFITTPYLNLVRRCLSHPVRSLYFLQRRLRGKKNFFWEYRFTRKELESYIREAGFDLIATQVDDYDFSEKSRHIGLWGDWAFLRKKGGGIWELNTWGKGLLAVLKLFPASWYCSGLIVVARTRKA